MADDKPKQRRGFAVMPQWRQREIASLGGKEAHARGKAHEFTSAEGRAASRKRGLFPKPAADDTEQLELGKVTEDA